MGFDISYHPICLQQMKEWYFSKLDVVATGDCSTLRELGQRNQIDSYYIDKYTRTMEIAARTKPNELFEKTHVYYIAVVQGFFLPYYYTRGTAFSFLLEKFPQMLQYTTSWQELKPNAIACPVTNRIKENYSGGVYIAPEQVKKLLADYEGNYDINEIIIGFFEQNTPVFIKALQYAAEHELGLIEASEVVEPNPTDLGETISYSNLLNCDKEGAFIYRDTALKQIDEFLRMNHDEQTPETVLNNATYKKVTHTEKKKVDGFFHKLFKK